MAIPFQEDIPVKKYVHPAQRVPAALFSYLLHPVFVPLYVIAFIVYIHPSYFSGFSEKAKLQTVIISALNLVMFPLISILLLKALGFIDSVYLRTRKDRIIPYMACGIFFFWGYTVFKKQEMYPPVMSAFILGIFIAVSAALMANIYFKVSMHSIGMGGWLGVFWVIAKENSMLMTWPLAAVLLLTGIVCTARLLISDHSQKDIYTGLAIGFLCQLVAAFVN
ncbi:MAG: phosphatase PAP2 family protein [Ferruginibacter sp.]